MTTYSTPWLAKRKRSKSSDQYVWVAICYIVNDDKSRRQITKSTLVECDPPSPSDVKGKATGKGARSAISAMNDWHTQLMREAEKSSPTAAAEGKMTVPEYVEYYWNSREVEESTRDHYKHLLKHIDVPMLRIPITDLTPTIVQSWVKSMDDSGLGQSMKNKCFNQLSYACRWGVKMQQLEKDPTAPVKAPKRSHHDPNPLDTDNTKLLLEKIDTMAPSKPTLANAAKLALFTGMRIGEICGLQWSDIDDAATGVLKTIHVNNVVARKSNGNYLKPYPKNRERRDIPANTAIADLLKSIRKTWVESGKPLTGFVFSNPDTPTQYPSPGYLGKQWSMFAAMSGVVGVEGKPPRFHDLRDTFATSALIDGIDVVTVAAILGHRNTETTLRHYARWMPNANAKAMERMGELLA